MTGSSPPLDPTRAPRRHWSLGAKLFVVALPFLLFGLVFTALTLWMSWQLEGGAAAINEAGRMRMQAYRLSLTLGTDVADAADATAHAARPVAAAGAMQAARLASQVAEFERSLALLRSGDPGRPLFVPWDDSVAQRFTTVEADWARFRQRIAHLDVARIDGLADEVGRFVADIDALVAAIEAHMSRWIAWLHLLQTAMMALAVLGIGVLVFTGYRFVVEPIGQLRDALRFVQRGDFAARVQCEGSDEFATLADGFNGMAEHVESMYRNLESQVAEKTAEVEEKRERLEALYDVTTLVARASSLEELASGFAQRIGRLAHADGVALRWSGETNQRYLMIASQGLPSSMLSFEACVEAGTCHCGSPSAPPQLRVIPIKATQPAALLCARVGFETLVSIPIVLHEHVLGEVDLFFHHQANFSASERSLLEALTAHLAGAMETLRQNALDKESAVSQERSLLARELHDSIAQSLAFLKIQVQLLRGALNHGDAVRVQAALKDIDEGVRESSADVRELLLHFRTRPNGEDMSPALQTTLRKFEHQSGLKASFGMSGQGLPLPPDVQIQALHIVQEALSNVRKHARATQVWLEVCQHPDWSFEVRDDGVGFDASSPARAETHVGLRIMAERAERIAGRLEVVSTHGAGCAVRLTVPSPSRSSLSPLASHLAGVAA
ncbi:MAG: type IV pili methyl-accepting chemotaxis transducer N-terminal domain-containing protein [Burkholderiaceae bacterium]